MRQIKTTMYLSLAGIFLGALNYWQTLKHLAYYFSDYQATITKTAIFNRLFIHTDFFKFEYMGGKNVILLISPFIFWIVAVVISSFFFLSLDEKYVQYVFIRSKNKRKGFTWLRQSGGLKIIYFSLIFHLTIFLLIFFGNQIPQDLESSNLIQNGLFLYLGHCVLLMGLWRLGFIVYLKVTNLGYVLVMSGLITFLFITNLTFPSISVVFIDWDNNYGISVLAGLLMMSLAYFWEQKINYEF